MPIRSKDSRIESDKDFVFSKKFNNSMKLLIKNYPNGVPDKVICKVLQISLDDFKKLYNNAISKLRDSVK